MPESARHHLRVFALGVAMLAAILAINWLAARPSDNLRAFRHGPDTTSNDGAIP